MFGWQGLNISLLQIILYELDIIRQELAITLSGDNLRLILKHPFFNRANTGIILLSSYVSEEIDQ